MYQFESCASRVPICAVGRGGEKREEAGGRELDTASIPAATRSPLGSFPWTFFSSRSGARPTRLGSSDSMFAFPQITPAERCSSFCAEGKAKTTGSQGAALSEEIFVAAAAVGFS